MRLVCNPNSASLGRSWLGVVRRRCGHKHLVPLRSLSLVLGVRRTHDLRLASVGIVYHHRITGSPLVRRLQWH